MNTVPRPCVCVRVCVSVFGGGVWPQAELLDARQRIARGALYRAEQRLEKQRLQVRELEALVEVARTRSEVCN